MSKLFFQRQSTDVLCCVCNQIVESSFDKIGWNTCNLCSLPMCVNCTCVFVEKTVCLSCLDSKEIFENVQIGEFPIEFEDTFEPVPKDTADKIELEEKNEMEIRKWSNTCDNIPSHGIGMIRTYYKNVSQQMYMGTGTVFYQNDTHFFIATSAHNIIMQSSSKNFIEPNHIWFEHRMNNFDGSECIKRYSIDQTWIFPQYFHQPNFHSGFDFAILRANKISPNEIDWKHLISWNINDMKHEDRIKILGFPGGEKQGELWGINYNIKLIELNHIEDRIEYKNKNKLQLNGSPFICINDECFCGIYSGYRDGYNIITDINKNKMNWICNIIHESNLIHMNGMLSFTYNFQLHFNLICNNESYPISIYLYYTLQTFRDHLYDYIDYFDSVRIPDELLSNGQFIKNNCILDLDQILYNCISNHDQIQLAIIHELDDKDGLESNEELNNDNVDINGILTIYSSDDQIFHIKWHYAQLSDLFRALQSTVENMEEFIKIEGVIRDAMPLYIPNTVCTIVTKYLETKSIAVNVEGSTLAHVMEYLEHYKGERAEEIPRPIRTTQMSQIVPLWDANFIDSYDKTTIFRILLAANYLGIQGLLQLGCSKIATLIKALSQEEINEIIEDGERRERENEENSDYHDDVDADANHDVDD